MTNTTKTKKYKGHLYNGGGIPFDAFAPVLEHEEGLILVTGSGATGKSVLVNRLVEYERTHGKQREILSIDETTPVIGVDHIVFPTWHNQPKLKKTYERYDDWRKEGALDAVGEMLETVMDHEVDIIAIDEIRSSEIATLAVALARHGYLVIAGIPGRDIQAGVNQLKSTLAHSSTFAEFAAGYEESSGYGDEIVEIVLEEALSIEWTEDEDGKMHRFLRDITIESYS